MCRGYSLNGGTLDLVDQHKCLFKARSSFAKVQPKHTVVCRMFKVLD